MVGSFTLVLATLMAVNFTAYSPKKLEISNVDTKSEYISTKVSKNFEYVASEVNENLEYVASAGDIKIPKYVFKLLLKSWKLSEEFRLTLNGLDKKDILEYWDTYNDNGVKNSETFKEKILKETEEFYILIKMADEAGIKRDELKISNQNKDLYEYIISLEKKLELANATGKNNDMYKKFSYISSRFFDVEDIHLKDFMEPKDTIIKDFIIAKENLRKEVGATEKQMELIAVNLFKANEIEDLIIENLEKNIPTLEEINAYYYKNKIDYEYITTQSISVPKNIYMTNEEKKSAKIKATKLLETAISHKSITDLGDELALEFPEYNDLMSGNLSNYSEKVSTIEEINKWLLSAKEGDIGMRNGYGAYYISRFIKREILELEYLRDVIKNDIISKNFNEIIEKNNLDWIKDEKVYDSITF